jgi:hypothetical protein
VSNGGSRENEYIEDLQDSCNSLGLQEEKFRVRTDALDVVDTLETYLGGCRHYLREMNAVLQGLAVTGDEIAAHTVQCPRISPTSEMRTDGSSRDPLPSSPSVYATLMQTIL